MAYPKLLKKKDVIKEGDYWRLDMEDRWAPNPQWIGMTLEQARKLTGPDLQVARVEMSAK